MDCKLAFGVVIGEGHVGFHGVGVNHREIVFALDNVRGRREGGVHIAPLHVHGLANILCAARKIIEIVEAAKSAADVVHAMNEHGAWRERARNIKHRRQLCVLDFDFVERLLRAQLIFADDRSHRLADKSNLADGQQGVIFYGVAIIRMKRAEIICREHVNDSRLALGLGNVDGENFGVRERAAEQLGPGHAFESNVACVGGASRHLGQAISARNGMIHDGKVLRVTLVCVTHDLACFLSVGPCNSAEACRMALSIPRYPVQRQRLPLM